MVREGDETIGKPLFLFDDIGDKHAGKKGKGSELLDSFYMTLRNFDISVIAISQQQNKEIGRIGVTPASEQIQQEMQESQAEQAPEEGQAPQQGGVPPPMQGGGMI
jgi:hypothetical protein